MCLPSMLKARAGSPGTTLLRQALWGVAPSIAGSEHHSTSPEHSGLWLGIAQSAAQSPGALREAPPQKITCPRLQD